MRDAAAVLLKIPPMWTATFLLAAYSCYAAARRGQGRDALLLLTLLLSGVVCVVYLCVAGNVLAK